MDELRTTRAETHVDKTNAMWTTCADALKEQVSEASWHAYLADIYPVSFSDDALVLAVPNTLIRDRVDARFLGLIQDTVVTSLGREVVVRLEVVAVEAVEYEAEPTSPAPPEGPSSKASGAKPSSSFGRSGTPQPQLDPRYTFDTFVIASSNRFAHAAAQGSQPTDEAQLVEAIGQHVTVVPGSPINLKITSREDLRLAEQAMKALPANRIAGPAHPFANDDVWR